MELANAVNALAALAQATRLEIFRLLVLEGSAGLSAGRVGELLDLPAPTLSFHLNHLRQAGLVTFRRDGRSLIYTPEYDVVNGLIAYLTENCCQSKSTCCTCLTLG